MTGDQPTRHIDLAPPDPWPAVDPEKLPEAWRVSGHGKVEAVRVVGRVGEALLVLGPVTDPRKVPWYQRRGELVDPAAVFTDKREAALMALGRARCELHLMARRLDELMDWAGAPRDPEWEDCE